MSEKKQKLSLLAEMITLMKSDKEVDVEECDFIVTIAERLGVSNEELNTLFQNNNVTYVPPTEEFERILQFYRLVLLMNVNKETHSKEIECLKELGIKMGLSPFATNRVLEIMDQYPNKIVPPDVLVAIFKTHYN